MYCTKKNEIQISESKIGSEVRITEIFLLSTIDSSPEFAWMDFRESPHMLPYGFSWITPHATNIQVFGEVTKYKKSSFLVLISGKTEQKVHYIYTF